jgi:hypothetical protein
MKISNGVKVVFRAIAKLMAVEPKNSETKIIGFDDKE